MSDDPPPTAAGAPTAWVTVAEAAERSGVGTSTVRQWYRSGRVPTQRSEGQRGAFLVPLDAVLALAQQADEDGDDVGATLIDLNASYWSAQTEAAREDAMAARRELAVARAELADATSELTASRDQLAFLRAQLAESSGDTRGLRDRIAALDAEHERLVQENRRLHEEAAVLRTELTTFREIRSATASITDNSWLDLPTNTYRSPVRAQGMTAADALSGMLASTHPDGEERDRAGHDGPDADATDRDPHRGPVPEGDPTERADEAAPAAFAGFGQSDDDLFPGTGKKGRRGRK